MNGYHYIIVEFPPSLEPFGIAFPPSITHSQMKARLQLPVIGAGMLRAAKMLATGDDPVYGWETYGTAESLDMQSQRDDADFFNQ